MANPREVIAAAVPRLEAVGIDDARRDAEVLLCRALDCDRAHLLGYPERYIEHARIEAFEQLIARRLTREPVSQIVGEREFWSLNFAVTMATLTPRPDSETVVEAVLDMVPDRTQAWRVLDLGTGTGCLLLSLLAELPAATGVGVDISSDAVGTAETNARRHGLDRRASFVTGDWAAAIEPGFDIVVSNPPYVQTGALAALDPEVAEWEPHVALDGGEDGLDAYRRILPDLPRLLPEGGVAVLEHGYDQAERVEMLACAMGLTVVKRYRDLAGNDRCLVLKR